MLKYIFNLFKKNNRYIYYIDGKKFSSDNYLVIPWYKISSPNENTPAFENLKTGEKIWCLKGNKFHRLTGPAAIRYNATYEFYLNDKCYYNNLQDWLKDHPNKSESFKSKMTNLFGYNDMLN
jgi:hypothetical protein